MVEFSDESAGKTSFIFYYVGLPSKFLEEHSVSGDVLKKAFLACGVIFCGILFPHVKRVLRFSLFIFFFKVKKKTESFNDSKNYSI